MAGRRIRSILLSALPYAVALILGGSLYALSTVLVGDPKAIVLSIAASFVSIPLLFLGYQVFVNLSKNELERDVFEYFKAETDTTSLTIAKHLSHLFAEDAPTDPHSISTALHTFATRDNVSSEFARRSILGFHLFRTFSEEESQIDGILKSAALDAAFSGPQRVALVGLSKALVSYRVFIRSLDNTLSPAKRRSNLRVVSGQELSSANAQYPNRLLLLEHVDEDKARVVSFGDFPAYLKDSLTSEFTIGDRQSQRLYGAIQELAKAVLEWLRVTGNEFLLRPDQFRFRAMHMQAPHH